MRGKLKLILCICIVIALIIGMFSSVKNIRKTYNLIESSMLSENSDKKFDIVVIPDSKEKHAGETVKLKINVEDIQMGDEGLNCVVGHLSYNDTLFDEISINGSNDWHFEMNTQKGHSMYGRFVAYKMIEGIKEDQEIAEITLKISNSAVSQSTEITFTEVNSGDENTSVQAGSYDVDIEIVGQENNDNPVNPNDNQDKPEGTNNQGESNNKSDDSKTEESANKSAQDDNNEDTKDSKNKGSIFSLKTGDVVISILALLIIAVVVLNVAVVKRNGASKSVRISSRAKIRILFATLAVAIGLLIMAITSIAYSNEINDVLNNLNNNESMLNSSSYLVTDEMISRILPNTSVADFGAKLNKDVSIYAGYPEAQINDGEITTGMRVSDGEDSYYTSVVGDLNGDAKCNQVDMSRAIRHIVNGEVYTFDIFDQTSADMNCDEIIDQNDIDAFVKYILYGEINLPVVNNIQAPKIEVIRGTYNQTAEAYEDDVLLQITKQGENTSRIMYKVEGTEQKAYSEIIDRGVVEFKNDGAYKISVYAYGAQGNRSEIAYMIFVKENTDRTYKITTRTENVDGTYQETTEEKIGKVGATVTYSEAIPDGYEINVAESTLSGTINENDILELVVTLNRKMYNLTLNAGEFVSSVQIEGEQNSSSITKSIKFGKVVNISAEVENQEGYTTNFERWVSGDRNILSDISSKDAQIEMPKSNIELTATATRNNNEDTAYTVEYYYQTNGTYGAVADETKQRSGETGATAAVTETDKVATRAGYVCDLTKSSNYSGTISGDGNLKLKVYFKQQFTVTYNAGEHGRIKNGDEYTSQDKHEGIDYGTSTPALQGEIVADRGYTFAGWDEEIAETVTDNKSYTATYTVNEIAFNGATLSEGVFGTEYVSEVFEPASNGSDSYSYAIKEGAPAGAFIDGENGANRKLVFLNVTPAGTYNVVVTAIDTTTGKTKDATFVVTINKQQVSGITALNIATDGSVTWTNSSNATGYEISLDGINYAPATNGSNYLSAITETAGTKTVYVRAINSDNTNYETVESSIASTEVTVCVLTVESDNTNYGTVTPTTYNVISGATYETNNNELIVKSGSVELKKFTANIAELPGYTTTLSSWSQASGTISENTTVTVHFTRTANTYSIAFNSNGGTGEMPNLEMTYDVEKTLTTNTYTRTGYAFKGWSTTENGEVVYTDGINVKNLATEGTYTLWAVWEDETEPSVSISNPEDTEPTATKNVTITISENGSGLSSENAYQYYVSNSGTELSEGEWLEYTSGAELTIGTGLNGEFYLFVKKVSDIAGNNSIAQESTDTTVEGISYHRFGPYKFGQSYTIVFNPNGGEGSMSNLEMTYGVEKNLPTNQYTKEGYTFEGWSSNANGNVEYDDGKSVGDMTTEETYNLYAIWSPNTNTAYHVYHYIENVDSDDSSNLNNYTVKEEEELHGTTDTQAVASPKEYEGFTYDAENTNNVKEDNIQPNGSLALKLYYKRNVYEVKLLKDEYVDTVTGAGRYKYGATVTINATLDANVGSTIKFAKWQSNRTELVAEQTTAETSFTMPAGDVNLRARINYGQKVNYSVEVNGQTLNDWELFLKDDDGYAYLIYGDYLPNAAIPSQAITAGSLSTDGTYRVWSTENLNSLLNSLKTPEYWNSYITRELQILAQNIEKTASATGTPTAEQFKKSWNNQYTAAQGQVNFAGDDTNGWSVNSLASSVGYAEDESSNLYYPHKNKVSDGDTACEGYIIASMSSAYNTRSLYIGYNGTTYNAGYANKDGSIRPLIKIPSALLELSEDGTKWNINYSSLVHEITLNNQEATTSGTTSIYEKYGVGFYLQNNNGTLSSQMKTTENGITIPEKSGFTFGGYYTEENGAGTQFIDENGKITSSAIATNFSEAGTLYAKWILNELTFDNQTINKTYSTGTQTARVTPANGGTGIYTYAKVSGDDEITVSEDGTITIPASKAANTEGYTVVISATDSITHATKNATYTIAIAKQTVSPVTNLAVGTDGTVTWTASDNATDYEISLDGNSYNSAESGVDCLANLTETDGEKTIYVRANNNIDANYETTNASVASIKINVYIITIESNNTAYGTVDTSSYNVISGVTYLANDDKLTISSGSKVLKTITATKIDEPGYETSLEGWSPDEGTISEHSLIMANFVRKISTIEITLDNQSATTAGTTKIYEKYNDGLYLQNDNGTLSNKMSTTENGITIPEKTGYTFEGYYTEANGAGTQYIDENGKLTSSAVATNFSENGTLYAKWTLNELTFENQTINKTFSTVSQTASVTPANGGAGNYTYAKVSGDNDITVSEDGTITIPANKAVGEYEVVIRATDSTTGITKDATYTIVIAKQTVSPVTNLAVSTAGIVTWDASENATGYEIKVDDGNYAEFTSGSNYLEAITETAGNKTIYVKAINSDTTNYESKESSAANKQLTVYSVTLTKGEGIEEVSGAGNYIAGATVEISATIQDGYSWDKWVQTSSGEEVSTTKGYSATINENWNYTASTEIDKFVYFDPQYSDITNWEYISKERFISTYNETTKMNDISYTGSGGYEFLYLQLKTVPGNDYEITFDFETDGYSTHNSKPGILYGVSSTEPYSTETDIESKCIAYDYLSRTASENNYKLSFTANAENAYFVMNFGYVTDNMQEDFRFGNLKWKQGTNEENMLSKILIDVPSKNGYTLSEWNTEADGSGTSYTNEEVVSSIIAGKKLYAVWTENDIEVTLDASGGIIPETSGWELVNEGAKATKSFKYNSMYGTLPTPTREGYTFVGWSEKKNILPYEYQEVEYVKFNGDEYIDTNIIPSNHTTEVKFDSEEYNNQESVLGTSKGINYYYFTQYANQYYIGFNGSEQGYSSWTTGDHTLIFNGENNKIQLDDVVFSEGKISAADVNLWIGNRKDAACFQGKIYYIKITDKSTGEIVRDMKPCYRKSDNVIGFYDRINGEFYTKQGTGTFDKGEDISTEYIISSTLVNNDNTLYAVWEVMSNTIECNSIVQGVCDNELPDGTYTLRIEGKTSDETTETIDYPIEVINYADDVVYEQDTELGDDSTEYKMLVVKYHKNLTVNENVTVTAKSVNNLTYKKGMYLCVMGTLTNNGTISMTAKGTYNQEGENVYLWKNLDDSFEYVPAVGGTGGLGVSTTANVLSSSGWYHASIVGNNGADGTNRALGGGGSGSVIVAGTKNKYTVTSSAGATATSYSGGSGSGGIFSCASNAVGNSPGANGGAGGNAYSYESSEFNSTASGGAGNLGGYGYSSSGQENQTRNLDADGENGTGGLLILYANSITSNGKIESNGSTVKNAGETGVLAAGAGSGGGSINIFVENEIHSNIIEANGGARWNC